MILPEADPLHAALRLYGLRRQDQPRIAISARQFLRLGHPDLVIPPLLEPHRTALTRLVPLYLRQDLAGTCRRREAGTQVVGAEVDGTRCRAGSPLVSLRRLQHPTPLLVFQLALAAHQQAYRQHRLRLSHDLSTRPPDLRLSTRAAKDRLSHRVCWQTCHP